MTASVLFETAVARKSVGSNVPIGDDARRKMLQQA
jgi:hypothetical protein